VARRSASGASGSDTRFLPFHSESAARISSVRARALPLIAKRRSAKCGLDRNRKSPNATARTRTPATAKRRAGGRRRLRPATAPRRRNGASLSPAATPQVLLSESNHVPLPEVQEHLS